MGYRVEYEVVGKKRKHRNGRLGVLTAAAFLFFLLLVNGFWPRGTEALRRLILPGDPAVTAMAWEELSRELRSGESVSGAVEGFCREIMDNAGLLSD